MKKLKLTLAIIIATVAISTGVFAYTGTDVDTHYNITMPSSLSQGKGTVSASSSGSFKYQFVETNASTYATLKKYDAQVNLIKAYIAGERANWEDATLNANYEAIASRYESTYNEKVSSLYQQLGNIDENALSDVRSLWIYNLPNFDNSKWETSTNKQVSIDLSTFTGTKYVVAWVQIGDMYDAEVYIVTGNKQEEQSEPEDNTPEDNTPEDNTPEDNTPENNKPAEDNDKKDDNTVISKGDQTKATGKMPQTGVNDVAIVSLMSLFSVAGVTSFVKYRRIK